MSSWESFFLEEESGPTADKTEAVKTAERPTCASEVRSFLGLFNFNGRFITDLVTRSEPLRKLTCRTFRSKGPINRNRHLSC